MNIELIRTVQAWLASPAADLHFDMGAWFRTPRFQEVLTANNVDDHLPELRTGVVDVEHCGTSCCLAGAAILFADERAAMSAIWHGSTERAGAELFEIDDEIAGRLFYDGQWPNLTWFGDESSRLPDQLGGPPDLSMRAKAWLLLDALASGRNPWYETGRMRGDDGLFIDGGGDELYDEPF